MANVKPIVTKKKVIKRRKKFTRYQSDRFMRVPESWRRPKGIESRIRGKFRGLPSMPNCGYGGDKKTKFLLPNGFKKFRVFSVKEVDMLLMQNRKYCVEIGGKVSSRGRREIEARCEQLNLRVTNAGARYQEEEEE